MSNILHVMTLFDGDFLWHTTHDDDPSTPWDPSKLERVSAIPGTAFRTIACATNQNNDLHACAVTENRGLYHTIRQSGSPWGDVIAEIKREHPETATLVPTGSIACATNQNNDLHVLAVTQSGGLYHTIRQAVGTWSPWEDVIAEIIREHRRPPNLAPIGSIACSVNPADGNLQVSFATAVRGQTTDGQWWYTLRFDNTGGWYFLVHVDAGGRLLTISTSH
jgi:hypothetical protein